MENILKDNFDMRFARRQVHGPGHYFIPDISLSYGSGLIFCQLLSDREFQGKDRPGQLQLQGGLLVLQSLSPGSRAGTRKGPLQDDHHRSSELKFSNWVCLLGKCYT